MDNQIDGHTASESDGQTLGSEHRHFPRSPSNSPGGLAKSRGLVNRQSAGHLYVKPLYTRQDSLTLGSVYKEVIENRRREYENVLKDTKTQLEPKILSKSNSFDGGHRLYQEELNSIHKTYQEKLDHLYEKLQKEWMKDPVQKAEVPTVPDGGLDSQYLACHVGVALKHALADVSEKRPWDPIEHIAHWLYKYAENARRDKQEAIEKVQERLSEEEEAWRHQREMKLHYEKRFREIDEQRRKELFLKRSKEIEELERKAAEEKAAQEKQAMERIEEEEGGKEEQGRDETTATSDTEQDEGDENDGVEGETGDTGAEQTGENNEGETVQLVTGEVDEDSSKLLYTIAEQQTGTEQEEADDVS